MRKLFYMVVNKDENAENRVSDLVETLSSQDETSFDRLCETKQQANDLKDSAIRYLEQCVELHAPDNSEYVKKLEKAKNAEVKQVEVNISINDC